MNRENIEPKIKILTKFTFAYKFRNILVGGGNDPYIYLDGL